MTQSNILIFACLGYVSGLFAGLFFEFNHYALLAIFITAPFAVFVFWKNAHARHAAVFLIFLSIGALYFSNTEDKFFNELPSGKTQISFSAQVASHPDAREYVTFFTVKPEEESGINTRVRITTDNAASYSYGEALHITGELERPENFADFNWQGYLAKEGIGYTMYMPEIKKLAPPHKSLGASAAASRSRAEKALKSSLLPPHSTLYSAMVLGDKKEITEEQEASLQNAGLSHIVAISGMHIATITLLLVHGLVFAGFWRRQAGYLSIILIAFYIIMVGAPASAVRAGIMASVVIVASLFGRPNSSMRALVITAAVMAAFNPLLPIYDVGYQLSFLAVAGIVLFSQKIQEYLKRFPAAFYPYRVTRDREVVSYISSEYNFSTMRGIIAVTISAQIFTLPVVLYHFGTASPYVIFTNLLVLPVLPYTLPAGFVAIAGGFIGGVAAPVLAAPAWLFSSYIWFVVEIFS